MKSMVALLTALLTYIVCPAQETLQLSEWSDLTPVHDSVVSPPTYVPIDRAAGNDTFFMLNNFLTYLTDSSVAPSADKELPADSGYVFGTSVHEYKAFAELYRLNMPADSSVHILGFLALFHGTVNPASTNKIRFSAWAQSPMQAFIGPNTKTEGFPSYPIDTMSFPVQNLGIGNGNDTVKLFFFDNPIIHQKHNFFAGYEMEYDYNNLNGDTISLRTTKANYGMGVGYYYLNGANDTIVIPRNVVRDKNGNWLDCYYHLGYTRNLSVVPIVQFYSKTASSAGIRSLGYSNEGLTLNNVYPNPANNYLNISFTLDMASDLKVSLLDITGKTVATKKQHYTKGDAVISLDINTLPAGDYIYLLQTEDGAIVAGKVTVE